MFSFVSRISDYWFPIVNKTKPKDLIDKMNVIADVSITPLIETSLTPHLKKCIKNFQDRGLKVNPHGCATNVYGDWKAIQEAVRDSLNELHEKDKIKKVLTTIQIISRTDKESSIENSIKSLSTAA